MTLAVWQRPDSADDFRSFYRAASLTQTHESVFAHPSFYPDKQANDVFLPYIRIPSYALMLRPLASLPYRIARPVWIAASIFAFLGCIWLFPGRRDHFALALAFSLPVAYAFVLAQDISFILLLALAAAYLFDRQREFAAGLVASLIAIKLTYLPAVGLVFLVKSRRSTLGIALGVTLQLALSFALEGRAWPSDYLTLLHHPLMDIEPRRMLSFRAIAASLALPDALWIAAAFAAAVFLWFAARRMTLPQALLLALPLTLITSPHCYVYDAVVLIPLMVTTATAATWNGTLALVALSPVSYLLLMTEHPALLLVGASLIVISTIAASVTLYLRSFPMRITGSVSPLSSGTAISSTAS
jgi:hypothetical protein